jgi:ADP-ribose pyrophosphatase YjhB (NUDIX family)
MPGSGPDLRRAAYRAWGRLPLAVRQFIIRRGTPSYHVGAICVIERSDGALLLVRNTYRKAWGFPGGFLKRGEDPAAAVRRETCEEIGVDVVVDVDPKVVVEPGYRRVDVIFRGRPVDAEAASSGAPTPRSPEIVEARWFPATELPDLQPEAVDALIQLGRSYRPLLSGEQPPGAVS